MTPPDKGVRIPPEYCQYAGGACDQDFSDTQLNRGIFLYPSDPENIAATIEKTVEILRQYSGTTSWRTWKDFRQAGQIIFCTICKNMRFSDFVVADVTTLNFNLLFEIGFAIGLGLPVIPIRDKTYTRDKHEFEELGMLDSIGYVDFQNSGGLATALQQRLPVPAIPPPPSTINLAASLYVLKSPIETEAVVRMMSTLKKSPVRFRTYDAAETPRLSLQEARKQVGSSLAVIAHLVSPHREGHLVHNARCALITGIAMATGKFVLLMQEGHVQQPIDYRDVVSEYSTPDQVPSLVDRLVLQVIVRLQDARIRSIRPPDKLLERVDLGDVAAENEIRNLRSYFVGTAQFHDAKRGNARLVIGRKGSGKSALFYAVRDSVGNRQSHLVLDMKPEGHQFSRLRETVLSKLTSGVQEHTLTAFWNYILLCEIAHKILYTPAEGSWAHRDENRRSRYNELARVYESHTIKEAGDLSERLLRQVDRIAARYQDAPQITTASELTELLFRKEIPALDDAVAAYLDTKDDVTLLIDNLDKSWPTRGATKEDILILRTLLDASRKLKRQLDKRDIPFRCLVFLRNDIYEHLLQDTPDKGKDTAIILDYDDPELFKQIVSERIKLSTGLSGSFDEIWAAVFETHIGTEDSFQYVLDRTLMRPRDLLNFLHRAIEVAINRGHDRVYQEDFVKAEAVYSEDILLSIAFEFRDVFPYVKDPLYVFLGCDSHMDTGEVKSFLSKAGYSESDVEPALNLLVWFGILGVQESTQERARYAYQVRHNIEKVLAPLRQGGGYFVLHPAFRTALESVSF
jgi:hypothetical protein